VLERAFLQNLPGLLIFYFPWLLLIIHLSTFWSIDPEYSFGWIVPIMAVFFFLQELIGESQVECSTRSRHWTLFGALLALLLIGPIWLIHDAVPDWSVVNWSFAFVVVLYQLFLAVYLFGLGSLKRFAFPILFILCAVPWPQRFELVLVQALMKDVASSSAGILAWLNVPALASGNLVHLPNGVVGIDEACSGVRSLQAMLMTSLFLGQLRRLQLGSRLGLVVAALGLALAFNVLRTATLVWIAFTHGIAAFERWHDSAGFTVAGLSFVVIWMIANRLPQKDPKAIRNQPSNFKIPWVFEGVAVSWTLFFLVGTEAWYRCNPIRTDGRWLAVHWPMERDRFQPISLSDTALRILLCDSAKCGTWRDESGITWVCYSLIWRSGRTSTSSARIHRPENCLQGSGAIMARDIGAVPVLLANTRLLFHAYLFWQSGHPLHVYHLIWEQSNVGKNTVDWSGEGRLKQVWLHQRNLGQQSLEVFLFGEMSDAYANWVLQNDLPKFVSFNKNPGDDEGRSTQSQ
jgi:exosortase